MKNQKLGPIWPYLMLIFKSILSTLFFAGFEPFLTKIVSGSNFQEVIERELEVFQANVAIWPDKTCILTGSTQNPAPKRICTLGTPSTTWYGKCTFWGPFFQLATNVVLSQQMLATRSESVD